MRSTGDGEPATLTPTDAFGVLGHETRLQILGTLAEAGEPLSFTQLRNRVGAQRGAQFNYHLDEVIGQFVDKTDEGYSLRLPGSRVVQAALSTAVTEDSNVDPVVICESCYHCGGSILMTYNSQYLALYCRDCPGNYNLHEPALIEQIGIDDDRETIGVLGGFELPPAGVIERPESELLRAGVSWQNLERQAIGIGMCPRCSGLLDRSVEVCDIHDASGGTCEECQHRYAILHHRTCNNCNFERLEQMGRLLSTTTEFLHFVTEHGINPITPESPMEFLGILDDYREEVLYIEPFRGRFTFTIDEDPITLTVDDWVNVIDAE